MKKIDKREYAIQTIEGLRRVSGSSLFDFGNILALPTKELQTYLDDEVYRPLQSRLGNASRNGFESISYVLYSAYDRDKDQIAFHFVEGENITGGRVPERIEIGLNMTKERHIARPKPIELMLYVKALQDEPLFIPDSILSRGLVFA